MLAGAGLLFSGMAAASDAGAGGPDWRDLALALAGLLSAASGGFVAAHGSRLTTIEKSLAATRELLLREYHPKDEIREVIEDALKPLDQSIRSLHARLDEIPIEHGRSVLPAVERRR